MTEKKLKLILREHPYLIDSAFVRSRSEAVRFAGESSVTVEEFIERCKKRSSLPAEGWDAFSEALADRRARDSKEKPAGKSNVLPFIPHKPRFIRRAAAVILILISLAAFLTLTEPGATLARAAYKIIVKLFDGELVALQGRGADDLSVIDFGNIPEHIETHEEAAKAIGRPVASLDPADAELVEIMVDPIPGLMVMLRTQYQVQGNTLFLMQEFYMPRAAWGTSDNPEIELDTKLQDGNIMYIGRLSDGTPIGYAYCKNYNITIYCMGMDINELRDIAEGMRFFE